MPVDVRYLLTEIGTPVLVHFTCNYCVLSMHSQVDVLTVRNWIEVREQIAAFVQKEDCKRHTSWALLYRPAQISVILNIIITVILVPRHGNRDRSEGVASFSERFSV